MFLKAVAFDIETLPLNLNQMPVPDVCPVILISSHFNYDYEVYVNITYGTVKVRNIVFILTKNYEAIEVSQGRIVYYYTDETKLINGIFKLIKENDIIISYNGNNFDFPYLIDRAKELGLRNITIGNGNGKLFYHTVASKGFRTTKIIGLTGKIVFDVLMLLRREDESNIFKKKYNLKKLTLEHVSKEVLTIEKLEFPIEDMVKYWDNTNDVELRNKFISYCVRDSELALVLFTQFRLLDKFVTLSRASGKLVQEVINTSGSGQLVENLLLQEFRKNDRVLPIRIHPEEEEEEDEEDEEELAGATVLDPKLGVSDNVFSADYSSLYPSIMMRHNLCYTTLVLADDLSKLNLTEDDVVRHYDEEHNLIGTFVKKEIYKGIVPAKLEYLYNERVRIKKDMKSLQKGLPAYMMADATQQAIKILLNSHYGYTGDKKSKIYAIQIAATVTANGRNQIMKTKNMIEGYPVIEFDNKQFKLEVIAGDTDSSYVKVHRIDLVVAEIPRADVIRCGEVAIAAVNQTLQKPMKLAFENYIKRIVIVAKKHYGMLVVGDDGKEVIITKGIETVRRDWCDYSTKNMSEVIDLVLKEKDVSVGIRKSTDLLMQKAKALRKDKVDLSELVLSKKLTKPITMYDNKAVHVQVAIKMKKRGKPSSLGDRIQYLILDNGKKLVSEKAEEAIYVMNNPDKCKIDKNFYLYHQLLPPCLRVLEHLGVDKELLVMKVDEQQTSLDRWLEQPICEKKREREREYG